MAMEATRATAIGAAGETSELMRNMPRLVIADSEILDFGGHPLAYAASVAEGAHRAGVACRILGAAGFEGSSAGCRIEGVFRRTAPMPKVKGPLRWLVYGVRVSVVAWRFVAGLRDQGSTLSHPGTVVFFPSPDGATILAVPIWLRLKRWRTRPIVVVMLRISLSPQGRKFRHAVLYRWGIRMLERQRRTRIVFVTDSARLAQEFESITRLPVHVVAIPHTTEAAGITSMDSAPGQPLNIVSLGSARATKGFLVLAKAIQALAEDVAVGVRFTLQTYGASADPEVAAAVDQLRTVSTMRIDLLDQPLPPNAYFDLLSEADLVVLPYEPWLYGPNTSGPFTEALAAGKPVIVTDDTWMSDQLQTHGAGVTFQGPDPKALIEAIRRAVDQFPTLREQARRRRPAWISAHNPDKLFSQLAGLTGLDRHARLQGAADCAATP